VAIAVECPHCGQQLRVNETLAGRKGKCPHCRHTFEIPQLAPVGAASASAAGRDAPPPKAPVAASGPPTSTRPLSATTATPDQIHQLLLAAFHARITPPQVGIVRKAGSLMVLLVLLLMPLFYMAVIGGLGYGMYWLATASVARGISPAGFWAAEAIAAAVLVCLIKPLLEPQRRMVAIYPVDLNKEAPLRELTAQLCQQIGAPPPKSVHVECSTRLSANSRRGGELVLGLPLVACLTAPQLAGLIAQQLALLRRGAGSGATNIIRAINRWLWRSVYGKSRFDQWLSLVAERPHFHLAKLLLPLAAARFPAQVVLFVPMFIANTVGASVVRRAELDADRTAARLVGRKTFAALLERVELVEFTWEGVLAELDFLHREQALPDNLPQQLALRMLDMTPELRAVLRETVNKPDEKPFDSRATTPERLEAIAGEPESGIFDCPLPAKALLANYENAARELTWDYYSARFGAQLLKTAMKPVVFP
jgi:predicted Zn finger-like uncharacterized protein